MSRTIATCGHPSAPRARRLLWVVAVATVAVVPLVGCGVGADSTRGVGQRAAGTVCGLAMANGYTVACSRGRALQVGRDTPDVLGLGVLEGHASTR